VARARIIRPGQASFFEQDEPGLEVVRILVPGASTERYGRIWHIGRTEQEDGFFYGRLGFEGSGTADLWSEADKDFQAARTPAGVASPFAVRLSDLRIAFQTRGRDIRVTSFTGALQGILRDESGDEDWRVETAHAETSFSEWRSSVQRVTEMRFHVEPPNPNYQGRPVLEQLIEGAKLSAADIDLHSEDGVNTDAEIVTELLDHVNRNYGRNVSVGERIAIDDTLAETVYSSELNGETEVSVVPANPETGEVERETLRRELTEPA
jgi:hypothetical protein